MTEREREAARERADAERPLTNPRTQILELYRQLAPVQKTMILLSAMLSAATNNQEGGAGITETETESRLFAMRRYVDNANLAANTVSSKDLLALAEFAGQDLYGALLLAIRYGEALGTQQEQPAGLTECIARMLKRATAGELRAIYHFTQNLVGGQL